MKEDKKMEAFLNQKGLIVTSDRAKGLLNAVRNSLPSAFHRYCALHLLGNIKGKFNDDHRATYWQIVFANTKSEFDKGMEKLKQIHKEAFEYLSAIDPQHWANYACPGRMWAHMCNNLSERAVKFIGTDNDIGRKAPIIRFFNIFINKVSLINIFLTIIVNNMIYT